jgi:plasmid stabilization system protein ParE
MDSVFKKLVEHREEWVREHFGPDIAEAVVGSGPDAIRRAVELTKAGRVDEALALTRESSPMMGTVVAHVLGNEMLALESEARAGKPGTQERLRMLESYGRAIRTDPGFKKRELHKGGLPLRISVYIERRLKEHGRRQTRRHRK